MGTRPATALKLAELSAIPLLLAACASTPPGVGNATAPTAPTASSTATAANAPTLSATPAAARRIGSTAATSGTTPSPASATRAPITSTRPITLAFAGDIHFANDSLRAIADDPQGLAPLKPYLSAADVTVVNLETAITSGGSPQPGKEYTFRAPASSLTTLANAGVDVAGMANNHSADYDDAGLADTLKAKATSPIALIGVGANITEADAPYVTTIGGVSIAILNVTPLWEQTTAYHTASDDQAGVAALIQPYTSDASRRFVAAVTAAAARYDVTVVWLHWGQEYTKCPTDKQFEVEKLLSAAGADIIAGGHSHRVQAGGWTGNTYVNYGLGSFVWWQVPSDAATGVLTLTIDPALVQAKRDAGASGSKSVVSKEAWQTMAIGKSGLPYVPNQATLDQYEADRAALMGCSKLRSAP